MRPLLAGLRAVKRSLSLVGLTLGVNVALALVVAVPLATTLERDLEETASAPGMLYGFDTAWWSQWHDSQSGPARGLSPEILGVGFAFKNLDLLLRGELPLGLFRPAPAGDDGNANQPRAVAAADGLILGLGALYMVVQIFLLGGILGVLRGEQGSWTLRGLVHGAGFYFGRLCRVSLVALLLDYVLFRLNQPFARWADGRAREAVSENEAMFWAIGHYALLLLLLMLVNLLSSLAKVIVVLEERSSALLAWLSALGFSVRHALATLGLYAGIVVLGIALLLFWHALDSRWEAVGYKTQLVTLLLAQALVFGRIALRFSLLAGLMALFRQRTAA